jgi:hypothetical protein
MDRKRLAIILLGIAGVIVIGVIALAMGPILFPPQKAAVTPTPAPTTIAKPTATPTQVANKLSPLIFGTNLGLFTSSDQVITSQGTQTLMQQMHVQIVRMPTRSSLPDSVNTQAAQAIKNIGAVPLVALRGSQSPNVAQVLTDDTRMINVMNQVFPNTTVYYEFGNEDDLNGIPMADYITRWNLLVPQFKKLTPHGKWIGPVSFQYNQKNINEFLQQANPRADAISWHEYTCSYKNTPDKCLTGLDKWPTHITGARQTMQSAIHTELPIMITEWNYASDQSIQSNGQPYNDGMWNNDTFMKQWTTKAIQTLEDNHVFASMQYSVTNTANPMINNGGTMTMQGSTFQSLYEQTIGNKK